MKPVREESQGGQRSGQLLLRMPVSLHEELARAAEADGVSLNYFIGCALAGAVQWRATGGDSDASGSHAGRKDAHIDAYWRHYFLGR
jgi:hypothetical protein